MIIMLMLIMSYSGMIIMMMDGNFDNDNGEDVVNVRVDFILMPK